MPQLPVALKIPHVTLYHDERYEDDYFWLREKPNPEVAAYLEAENAFADAVMAPYKQLEERLYQEMLSHMKQTDENVPYRKGDYFYYSRTEEGKQYPIYCRKQGSLEVEEEVVLDLNALAVGQQFLALGGYEVSDDGRLLAYSTDTTGFRQYTLFVKDLRTSELLPERIEKTGSIAWAADNTTLFYTVEDPAKRQHRLYRHRLRTAEDILVYEETDERFSVSVRRTRSKAYLFCVTSSHTTSEARFLSADTPTDPWTLIAPREHDHEYYPDHHGDLFYIRTNNGGRNFRLTTTPVTDSGREHWREVVPHRADVMLEGVVLFADHCVLVERQSGLPQIRITDLRTADSHAIIFPEPAYSAGPDMNAEWNTAMFRYNYQSLVTPPSIYDYDMNLRTATLRKRTEVPGRFEPENYVSERVYATAGDGVRVPISLVYRRDAPRNGTAPLYLTAYGSYGFPLSVGFRANRLSLLDRGVVVALAHIRGGGEMGKAWHDDGRMMRKRNTFTDFIAAAEHLIANGYGSCNRLVIEGGSAGGLLMGAVTNLRPDLFKAVVAHVPFMDVINTMMDPTLPLTVGEYEEWGNPNERAAYDTMKAYSPYDNLEAREYPAILVKTSFNDSQVMYWEPAKYVARLRTRKTDENVLLLKTNMAAGHGGSSGRYDSLHEAAFDYAFMLPQMGIDR